MMDYLLNLPLHQYINIGLLLGSTVLCCLLIIIGAALQLLHRARTAAPLPHIYRFNGSGFPNIIDESYTFIFTIFFAFISLGNVFSEPEELSASDAWLSAFTTLLIYAPMALRYISLPPQQQGTPFMRDLGLALLTLVAIYFSLGILDAGHVIEHIIQLTDAPSLQSVSQEMTAAKDPTTLAALCFSAIIVAPIMEEVVFRGFLYNTLRQRAGIPSAILASSLFFSAIHTSLAQSLPLFIFACAQCLLYEKSNSLRAPIITHMLFNTVTTIFLLFQFS